MASGQQIVDPLRFQLLDAMGQILTKDTTSQLRLISIDAFSSVVGKNDIVVDNGIGIFETVSLISTHLPHNSTQASRALRT